MLNLFSFLFNSSKSDYIGLSQLREKPENKPKAKKQQVQKELKISDLMRGAS